jgi:hypothetical protein
MAQKKPEIDEDTAADNGADAYACRQRTPNPSFLSHRAHLFMAASVLLGRDSNLSLVSGLRCKR